MATAAKIEAIARFRMTNAGRQAIAIHDVAVRLTRSREQLRERRLEALQLDAEHPVSCPLCDHSMSDLARSAVRERLASEMAALVVDVRYYEQRLSRLAGVDEPSALLPGYTVAEVRRLARKHARARAGSAVDSMKAARITAAKRAHWEGQQ